jgi:hypothetical protein
MLNLTNIVINEFTTIYISRNEGIYTQMTYYYTDGSVHFMQSMTCFILNEIQESMRRSINT